MSDTTKYRLRAEPGETGVIFVPNCIDVPDPRGDLQTHVHCGGFIVADYLLFHLGHGVFLC
jgi:hypothetical protein